jgi:hypothetical protein
MISTAFRRQAVNRMCDVLHERLRLSERPTAIAAPPSNAPDGPAVAVLIDSTRFIITADDEVQVDADGQILMGATAVLESMPNIDLGGGAYLSHVGSMVSKGRIWVGARLPAKREELEARIMRVFFEDTANLGTWTIDIPNPEIGEYVLPVSWNATAVVNESTWTGEQVFSERLWSWLTFDLEVAILVPRDNPAEAVVKQFIFGMDVHVDQPVIDGVIADLDDGSDNEYYTDYPPRKVNSDGV